MERIDSDDPRLPPPLRAMLKQAEASVNEAQAASMASCREMLDAIEARHGKDAAALATLLQLVNTMAITAAGGMGLLVSMDDRATRCAMGHEATNALQSAYSEVWKAVVEACAERFGVPADKALEFSNSARAIAKRYSDDMLRAKRDGEALVSEALRKLGEGGQP